MPCPAARGVAALAVLVAAATAAPAQERIPSHCIAIAGQAPAAGFVQLASYGDPLPADRVRLHFVDHAMFLIETAGGLTAATDFTGFLGPTELIPDVVTMNRAHGTHYTDFPDPAIDHVLPGWNPAGGPADHHLDLGEMLVRNVPTDIRGRSGTVVPYGNSIFVFEVAGLCIGHLGHLHHEPTPEQYALIGRLDVVMAPVDGGMTLDLPTMIATLKRLRSSVVIPMHWFGPASLDRFLDGIAGEFRIDRRSDSAIELSLDTLPPEPTVIVLQPRLLD